MRGRGSAHAEELDEGQMQAMANALRARVAAVPTFEPLVIRCPSAVVCAVIMVQILAIGLVLDYMQESLPKEPTWGWEPTHFQQWVGFYMLGPSILSGLVALYLSNEYDRRANIEQQARLGATLGQEGELEMGPGLPETAEEHAREVAANKSWLNKATWFGFMFFLPAAKLSFDMEHEYSWTTILAPFHLYFGYFLWIAIAHRNYMWSDQRTINQHEAINRLLVDARAESLHPSHLQSSARAGTAGEQEMVEITCGVPGGGAAAGAGAGVGTGEAILTEDEGDWH